MTTTSASPSTGRVMRVSGPLVEVDGLSSVAVGHVVDIGSMRVPGEVVAIRETAALVQAYEYTGGIGPGTEVTSRGEPLSVELGPGLLGGVFDGLLRPLQDAGIWLDGRSQQAQGQGRGWVFEPSALAASHVRGGDRLGAVSGTGSIPHQVLVPPGIEGELRWVAGPGIYSEEEPIAWVANSPIRLRSRWPVRRTRPCRRRLGISRMLATGQRVLDLLFPLARGSTAAVPGGFGTGKTVLLQQIAKWCQADVIVYVGCGERGNEMAEVLDDFATLTDPRTGGSLGQRTVVIANASNMPLMAREVSIYAGVTVAEYFRDMGYSTVVIADSTSRWAEALREFAGRSNELPAEEGFPAGLGSALAAFYERSGEVETLGGTTGSVTIIGAVSPPGGDMTEPVTSLTQRFVRCVWMLDRTLAYARHYPAVAWAGSFSRDAEAVGQSQALVDPDWPSRRQRIAGLLAEADRLQALADLVGVAALAGPERMVLLAARLLRLGVLQQNALNPNDAACTAAKASALADALLAVSERATQLVAAGVPADAIETHDMSALVRAREHLGPDDVEGVRACAAATLAALDQLREAHRHEQHHT